MNRAIRSADGLPRRRAPSLVAALVVAVATAACFAGSLENQFVEWDDQVAIVANPHIRGLSGEHLAWMFTTFHLGPYQPLAWLSLAADYSMWGLNPRGFHLTSLVIHVANALLVYLLAYGWIGGGSNAAHDTRAAIARAIGAAAAALVFGIHPQRVESVALATERRDVLCGLFTLCALLAWRARHRDVAPAADGGSTRALRWYLLALGCFVLALASKASVMGLPIVLFVTDRITPARGWSSAEAPRRVPVAGAVAAQIPFVAAAVAFAVAALHGQHDANAVRSLHETSGAWRVGVALYATMFYLAKFVWPLRLSPLYEAPANMHEMLGEALFAGAAFAAVSVGCWMLRRHRPELPAAWLCYLALLAPMSGLVPIGSHLAADRYTYVACLPLAILAGFAVARAVPAIRRLPAGSGGPSQVAAAGTLVAAALMLAGFAWLTPKQVEVWSGTFSLWEHAVRIDPRSSIAYYGRAVALARAGREQEAVDDYSTAIRLRPDYGDAHNNLAAILAQRGDLAGAEQHFLSAEKAAPSDPLVQFNLGVLASTRGDGDTAARRYRRALDLRPDLTGARINLAQVFVARGDSGSARALLLDGLALAPADSTIAASLRDIERSP